MKKFYICGVERLVYWIDERYLGCYSFWGSCGVVELPGGLGDCTSSLNMQRYPKFKEYLSKVAPMDKAPSPRHLDEVLEEKGPIKNDEDGKR
jgi:hypothetical protein